MGSVKSLDVDERPTSSSLGRGSFVFSDDYSVFDWGGMPDTIDHKGASLCATGAYTFELLEDEGVPTHYVGVEPEAGGGPVGIDEVDEPPRRMAIEVAQVPDLRFEGEDGYDYDGFHDEGGDSYLVPLEVVFRNSVPEGSSLRERRSPDDLGLDLDTDTDPDTDGGWPDETVALDEPIVEFSTKFEERDRYVDDDEARRISGLDREALGELRETAHEVNRVVTEHAEGVGLSHQDGKIECVYHDGGILVADVAGTFDENRFLRDGAHVSKEFLRQFYRTYDPDWVDAVYDAKAEAGDRGVSDWRGLCDASPKPLPDDVLLAASDLYAAGADVYLGRDLFDAPDLDRVLDRVEARVG